jgi:hypothetical protein
MKKICLLFLMLLLSGKAFAAFDNSLCPQPPYPVRSGIPLFFSNITGSNLILTGTLETVIQNELKKQFGAKFDVQIYPYGAKDLMDGKFKRVTANAKNVVINNWYITSVTSDSVCGYNRFVKNGDEVYSAENFLSKFEVVISSDDLNKIFQSSEYAKMLNSAKFSFNQIIFFRIFDPAAVIVKNRIDLSFKWLSSLGASGAPAVVSLNTGLAVENGKIKFTDIRINKGRINLDRLLPLINKINPFVYETDIMKTKGSIVQIDNVNIVNNNSVIQGSVFIPKS